jgi:hypothetical protein
MMRRQLTLKRPPRFTVLPDLGLLDGVIAPRVLDALRVASEQLTKIGVPPDMIDKFDQLITEATSDDEV